jgi:hypothetical protein
MPFLKANWESFSSNASKKNIMLAAKDQLDFLICVLRMLPGLKIAK